MQLPLRVAVLAVLAGLLAKRSVVSAETDVFGIATERGTGSPIARASAALIYQGRLLSSTRTENDGWFHLRAGLSAAPQSVFALSIAAAGFELYEGSVSISEGITFVQPSLVSAPAVEREPVEATSLRFVHFLVTDAVTGRPLSGARVALTANGKEIVTIATPDTGVANLPLEGSEPGSVRWRVSANQRRDVEGDLVGAGPPYAVRTALLPSDKLIAIRGFPVLNRSLPNDAKEVLVVGDRLGLIQVRANWKDGSAEAAVETYRWALLIPARSFAPDQGLRFSLSTKVERLPAERLVQLQQSIESTCKASGQKNSVDDAKQRISRIIDEQFDILLGSVSDISRRTEPLELARAVLIEQQLDALRKPDVITLDRNKSELREDPTDDSAWRYRLVRENNRAFLYLKANAAPEQSYAWTAFISEFSRLCAKGTVASNLEDLWARLGQVVVVSQIGLKAPRVRPSKWFVGVAEGFGILFTGGSAEANLFAGATVSYYPRGSSHPGFFKMFSDREPGDPNTTESVALQLTVGVAIPFQSKTARPFVGLAFAYNPFASVTFSVGAAIAYNFDSLPAAGPNRLSFGPTLGLGFDLF